MVMNCIARFAVARILMLILFSMLFAGCVSDVSAPDESEPYMQGTVHASADYYLQQMNQGGRHSRVNWQLLAIRTLLQSGQQQQAQALYQQLPNDLDKSQQTERTLLAAHLALLAADTDSASTLLNSLTVQQLTLFQQQRYWQLQIDTRGGQPSLALLRALIAQQPLLSGEQQQRNIDTTWQVLTKMTPQQADNLVINASEYTLRGWLDLQHIWFTHRDDPALLQSAIKSWQTRYPENPAAQMLPEGLRQGSVSASSVQKVALFLPLQGQSAVFAEAIRQGFMMAKNNGTRPVVMPVIVTPPVSVDGGNGEVGDDDTDSVTGGNTDAATDNNTAVSLTVSSLVNTDSSTATSSTVTSSTTISSTTISSTTTSSTTTSSALIASAVAANPAAELKIYDTSAQPLAELLQQAQQDGVMLVVGPLMKDDVELLPASDTRLNVLALNQPKQASRRPNICYFALSPEDEARDAAAHIWRQGQRQPLVLVPRGDFGHRVAQAFAGAWQQQGGGIVLQQSLGSVTELKQEINLNIGISLTGIPVNVSEAGYGGDAGAASSQDGVSVVAEHHNDSVDAVYIIASQQELALIRPMIAMKTSSRRPVAYYASSRSVQGGTEVDFRIEMDALQFSDIPMLAGADPAFMQQALNAVQGDYSLARLYAMGADAWTLANHFVQLQQTPGFKVAGNTGQLTADQNCVIHRTLTWLKYQQGKILSVQDNSEAQ